MGRDTKIIILLGITILIAVLFEAVWMMVQSRAQPRWRISGTPLAKRKILKAGFFKAMDRLTREWKRNQSVWENRWGIPLRAIRGMVICAILALAAVPSFLVVQDRWLNWKNVHVPLTEFRCKLPLLCNLELPPYFLFITVCLLAAGLLIAFFPTVKDAFDDRRAETSPTDEGIPGVQIQISRVLRWAAWPGFIAVAAISLAARKIPGWELALVAGMYVLGWFLRDISMVRIWGTLRENRGWIIPCLLFHAALVATLAVYFSAPDYLAPAIAGLALAGIILFRFRRRVPSIYWIFSLGLTLFSININSWWVALVGDEYGFYGFARVILEKVNLSTLASHLFDEMGVYEQNPYLGSIIQSMFMRVFGTQSFGWRFSNVYLAALSIPFFFYFFKEFLNRRTALTACFFLAVSEYLINFSKIGYVSLQSLLALSVSLAAATWAVRSGRLAAFAAAGAVLAMNFYFFGIAIVGIPLAGLLLLWFIPPLTRLAWRRWGVFAAGFGMLFFPLLLQPEFWRTGFGFTVFGGFENRSPSDSIVQIIFNRVVTSWFSYLYSPNESHFVAVSFVDWGTALLIGIGFFVILYQIRRGRFALFFLAGWGILLGVAAIIGSPALPSTTRMFVLLPWWAAAAAVGLQWLLDRIPADSGWGKRLGGLVLSAVLIAVAGINLVQATVVSYARWLDRQVFEAYVLRLAGETRDRSSGAPEKFIFLTYSGWSLDPFLEFQEIYPRDWVGLNPEAVVIVGSQLPESAVPMAMDSTSLVFVVPTLPQAWQEGLRISLQALGDQWCPVYNPGGAWVYDLYTPKDKAWVCSAAK